MYTCTVTITFGLYRDLVLPQVKQGKSAFRRVGILHFLVPNLAISRLW